ncbi:hypothetical protein SH449x_003487 [Pirellulaceae bacterium SH449]
MRNASNPTVQKCLENAHLIWGIGLLLWLAALCFLPDPRPLGAPEWSVRAMQSLVRVSEPTARAASTFILRSIGIGMIGVLLSLSLKPLDLRWSAPLVLLLAPLLAIGAKWINFGYFPIPLQVAFILAIAILGALAGLSLRRSRIAAVSLLGLSAALVLWGASTGVPSDVEKAARSTGLYLLSVAEEIPQNDDAFIRLLEKAFAYAEDNSHGTDPVLPNRAAILALGMILGDDQVARLSNTDLDPDRSAERVAIRRRSTLHGRQDLSMHFWVSAALTVLSDENRALTVGLVKEMKDSTAGGSGFSFVDMAANKAGIRFAVRATQNATVARTMQMRILQGASRYQFMPDISGLPEGISDDQFQALYGGLGGQETLRLLSEIDQRINACDGLQ